MRVYFLSYKPAILKLNGLYVGGIDLFERHIELEIADSVLAEIVPGENLQPVNFFINEQLLFCPPEFMDVYLYPRIRLQGRENFRHCADALLRQPCNRVLAKRLQPVGRRRGLLAVALACEICKCKV